jgi:thiopeptide-type bacteriocin biosynthesis protein
MPAAQLIETDPCGTETGWRQVWLRLADPRSGEHTAVTHVYPTMRRAEDSGAVTAWFFVRKQPWWRLRYLPTDRATDDLVTAQLVAHPDVAEWTTPVYEAEEHAFGGVIGMRIAHGLFHHDSRSLLAYLTGRDPVTDKRRELSLLLCTAMMRAAGLDWYEQGDTWARVAQHRLATTVIAPAVVAQARRLMSVDTGPDSGLARGRLAEVADWLAGLRHAGSDIAAGHRAGTLTRGLRAILAHHIVFHWNRLGLPYRTQATLAAAARDAVLHDAQPPKTTGEH